MLRASIVLACLATAASGTPLRLQLVPINTGLAHPVPYVTNVPEPGPGSAFRVSEAKQGSQDLNGDGDTLDEVVAIVPPSGGPAFVVGLASDFYGPASAGHAVALGVLESAQGGQDLNGDFDTSDIVVHLIDAETGVVTNTGLAIQGDPFLTGQRLALSESFVAIAVDESAQGAVDLDGNGKTTDRVLHVVDLATGTVVNTGLLATRVAVDGGVVHGEAAESALGTDINGDGDTNDTIQFLMDAARGTATYLFRASHHRIRVSDGYATYSLRESQVGQDLNGDGDQLDFVVHVRDLDAEITTNTGLALHLGNIDCDGPYAAFVVPESGQGQDLNGDGDLGDFVVHSVHLPTAKATNSGLSGNFLDLVTSGLDDPMLSVRVNEAFQGAQDLNGDGDALDVVLHLVRLRSGAVLNTGHQTAAEPGGRLVGMSFSEAEQGGQDLNGDGDLLDEVLHVYDAKLGTTTNLGLEGGFGLLHGPGDDVLLVRVDEGTSGTGDLNGDGDTGDSVWHLILPEQPPQNLGVAFGTPSWIAGRRVVFAVTESEQGAGSLNGDADTGDVVMHYVDVP